MDVRTYVQCRGLAGPNRTHADTHTHTRHTHTRATHTHTLHTHMQMHYTHYIRTYIHTHSQTCIQMFHLCGTNVSHHSALLWSLQALCLQGMPEQRLQGIRVSYLDWGAFSHGLFLQAPSKQRKEKSTKQKERQEMETKKANQAIDGSFVQ